jgi:hypothetical protein
MENFLGTLANKLSEFIARDAIYMCCGAFVVSAVASLTVGSAVVLELLRGVPFLSLVIALPFFHVIGFAIRAIAEAIGLVTIAIPDYPMATGGSGRVEILKSIFTNSNKFPYYFSTSDGAVGAEVDVVDEYLSLAPSRVESRTFAMYKRALFLKEITATCGSSLTATASIYLLAVALDLSPFSDTKVSAGFILFCMAAVGVFICRLSVYHAYRQGRFIKAMERQLRSRPKESEA